jgi:hypothetical protein
MRRGRRLTSGHEKCFVSILEVDCVVEYDFKVTSLGSPMKMPDFRQPGCPAEPMEFEVDVTGIYEDTPGMPDRKPATLEMPTWLKEWLDAYIIELDSVYEAVERSIQESYDE